MGAARTLAERFLKCLDTMPGCESIDRDVAQDALGGARRGDYLVRRRRVVLEVKSLEEDTAHKVETQLDEHRDRPDFPVFYWPAELSEVLKYLSDGEEIGRRIYDAVTRPIMAAVENANRQVAATKKSLRLDDAGGALVLLNESIGILAPEIIGAQVSRMLNKRTADGRRRYREIAAVLLITESHTLSAGAGKTLLPVLTLLGPEAPSQTEVVVALEEVTAAWAVSQGRPLLRPVTMAPLAELKFRRRDVTDRRPQQRLAVRHEVWRASYRESPYMRPLPDGVFTKVAAEVFRAVAATITVGGPRPTGAEMERLWSAWNHVLEEAERRGFNMRHMTEELREKSGPIT